MLAILRTHRRCYPGFCPLFVRALSSGRAWVDPSTRALARRLWTRQFARRHPRHSAPLVIWSARRLLYPDGESVGVTTRCGIVLSWPACRHNPRPRRATWIRNLLLHELIHWSGLLTHGPHFRSELRRVHPSPRVARRS